MGLFFCISQGLINIEKFSLKEILSDFWVKLSKTLIVLYE